MMKRIVLWLNIVHYCLYKAECKRHHFTNKVNPFVLLGRIPRVRRNLEEQGTTLLEVTDKIWGDRRTGFSVMISGGALVSIIFLVILSTSLFINSLFEYPINLSFPPFALCMGLAYGVCYILVFQRDKYIKYFKKFDKWTKAEKQEYGIASTVFIVVVTAFFIYCFRFVPKL